MKIKPAKCLKGVVKLPGDKSVSHRAAVCAAMAEGDVVTIENFSTAADCVSTLKCLADLGVEIRREGSTVFIKGVGKTGFQKPEKELDCENSGTTMRLLAGVLAAQPFDSVLTGDESLLKRPMRRIIEPLEMMGAKIESEGDCAPLRIYGKNPLKAIDYASDIASAQVKSCILFAGLNAAGKTAVTEKTRTRDHTERMLRGFGAAVGEKDAEDGKIITVSGEARLQPGRTAHAGSARGR